MKFANDSAFGDFYIAYQTAALWSSTDEDGTPLDKQFLLSDIDDHTQGVMRDDCVKFWEKHRDLIVDDPEQAGHDFWLTRNHHGAGFWDGDWEDDAGRSLTDASHEFGSYILMVNPQDESKVTGF